MPVIATKNIQKAENRCEEVPQIKVLMTFDPLQCMIDSSHMEPSLEDAWPNFHSLPSPWGRGCQLKLPNIISIIFT